MKEKVIAYYGIRKTRFGYKVLELSKEEFLGTNNYPFSFDFGASMIADFNTESNHFSQGQLNFYICADGKMLDGDISFGNWILDNQIDYSFRQYCKGTVCHGYASSYKVISERNSSVMERYVQVCMNLTIESLIEELFNSMERLKLFINIRNVELYDSMEFKGIRYFNPSWGTHSYQDLRSWGTCVEIKDRLKKDIDEFISCNKESLSDDGIRMLKDRFDVINSYVADLDEWEKSVENGAFAGTTWIGEWYDKYEKYENCEFPQFSNGR